MKNKTWEKPELVVLSRSTPEERVLGACKVAGSGIGANAENLGCYQDAYPCVDCSTVASS